MSMTETPVDNGVNVEALLGARQAMSQMPEAAAFVWKATSTWVNGAHTRTAFEKFFGAGDEQSHTTRFEVDTDHPPVFAAEDNGITPVETVLAGLSGCLCAGIASVAQNRGIQLHRVDATLEGDMDLQGILGIDPDVRNGYAGIRVRFDIDADASDDEVRALVAQSQKRSAVYDIIANPTAIVVEVA
ncbi:MAG: OsmC family protein [Actinomycetota bacterium]